MKARSIARTTARAAGIFLTLPWRALRSNIAQLRKAKESHRDNIVYLRDLLHQASAKARDSSSKLDDDSGDSGGGPSFEETINRRPPGSPSIERLCRRFLRQKRLALGTCSVFVVISLIAIARGNLLGIATLFSCLPLFFMSALASQLRLWQLRNQRLSKEEGGGLDDFLRESGWYLDVLNPEINALTTTHIKTHTKTQAPQNGDDP